MCIYTYVCIYIYVCVYIYIHICLCVNIYILIFINIYIYHFGGAAYARIKSRFPWKLYDMCACVNMHVDVHARNSIHLSATARKLVASQEILLWMTPSETPKALQASECSELLDPMRASCWISAQH